MRTNLRIIHEFLAPKKLAIAGVSRDPKKFGYAVYKELKQKGFEIYPVNPNADEIDGMKCYKQIIMLPPDVDRLLIVTPKDRTSILIEEAVAKRIPYIWIQQKSETKEAIDFALSKKVNLIARQCILMHAEPVKSFHKFHRGINKIFGLFPKKS